MAFNFDHNLEVTSTFTGSTMSPNKNVKFANNVKFDFKQHLLKNFTPAYFVSVMGTGISSTILYNFPYEAHWLRICGLIMYAIAIILFITTTVLFTLSLYYFPGKIRETFRDPSVSVFLGCYPMGYITLINMAYLISKDKWIVGIYVLWWIAVAMSLYTAWITTFILISKSAITTNTLHSTLLLPIVPLCVVSSSGGAFTMDLPTRNLQLTTILVCYLLWANAISASFCVITIYFWKLFVHKIPSKELVFSSFLPVGVLGQGSYGILLFGRNCHQYILNGETDQNSPIISNIILYSSLLIALFLVSFGFFCTFIAIASCVSYGCARFHKGWWSMTFPLGTMSLANTEVYRLFHLETFRVVGAIFAVALVLITTTCLICSFGVEFGYDLYREIHAESKSESKDSDLFPV